MEPLSRLSSALETLPRVRFAALGRPVPAFQSCGIAGFYCAVLVTLLLGLARGRSLAVLAALCAVCGVSFFAYALARKALSGRETLVLLEHVWCALLCSAGALLAMGAPPLGYLDAAACGLAFFLAAGRIGCFLVGCCHGQPSDFGVRYGEALVSDGFAPELVWVRLFPVQLVEAGGLVALGIACCGLTLLGADGSALTLFLAGYGVMRFGLEGLRADRRPHFFGVSQSRWMAIAEVAAALWLAERRLAHPEALAVLAGLGALALAALVRRQLFGFQTRALRPAHLDELRAAVLGSEGEEPSVRNSRLGFTVAASHGGRVVSLGAPESVLDLPLVCAVAAAAFPELEPASAAAGAAGILVFELPEGLRPERAAAAADLGHRLYWRIAGVLQRARELPSEAAAELAPEELAAAAEGAVSSRSGRDDYFGPRSRGAA